MGIMDNFINKKGKQTEEDKLEEYDTENEDKVDKESETEKGVKESIKKERVSEPHNRELSEEERRNLVNRKVGVDEAESKISEDDSVDEAHNKIEAVIRKTPIGKYLDGEVTDIQYYATEGRLRIQDNKGSRVVFDDEVDNTVINNLGKLISGEVGKTFDKTNSILDTAVGRFRMNFMNEKVSPFGPTMSIRVSKPTLAIQDVTTLAPPSIIQVLNLGMKVNENMIISGQTGSGKAIHLEEEIDTPDGVKKFGELKEGDFVYDRLGKPTKVLGVYPQGKISALEVELTDGRKVVVNEEHIWSVYSSKGNLINKTTKEIKEDLYWKHMRESCKKHYIPMNGAVEKTEKEFKVHPYAMGAFLGDGCLNSSDLTMSSEDDWIPSKVANLIGSPELKRSKGSYSWHFRLPEDFDHKLEGVHGRTVNLQTGMIIPRDLVGLCDTRYIPEEYFEGSIEQRYELLQGLMDTDGSISGVNSGRYTVKFHTSSEQLGKDVVRLGRSLGFKMTFKDKIRKREGRKDSREINVNFLVPNEVKHKIFSLPRKVQRGLDCKDIPKKARYDRIAISDIRELNKDVDMACIMVDNDEHLFQVGQGIVSHNTELQKFLVGYIPDSKNITLMEDTPDSHLKVLYPNKTINSWITNTGGEDVKSHKGFTELLKSALRNNPDWVIISETRGDEARYMVDAAQTDHAIITTLHASGAPMIITRILSMISQGGQDFNEEMKGRDIAEVLTIGVHMYLDRSNNKMNRFIREVVEFTGYGKGGAEYEYLYRVLNDYNEDTGEYTTKTLVGPVSERFVEKLKLNRLYHKLPVYHDPRAYVKSEEGKYLFNVKKAEEIYRKQMEREGKEVEGEFEVPDDITNIQSIDPKEKQVDKARAYAKNKRKNNK